MEAGGWVGGWMGGEIPIRGSEVLLNSVNPVNFTGRQTRISLV